MKQILREPLLHFLLAGAALFAIYQWASGSADEPTEQQIVVNPGRIEQFATVFAKTWQRPPTREELEGLVDDFVLEEIYYRQAVAMGIDRDDTVIRRRLRQKLEFLTDDATSLAGPTEEQLEAFLQENESRFRESPKYTFRQIYFNPEKHGEDPEAFFLDTRRQLRESQTGRSLSSSDTDSDAERSALNIPTPEGDPSLLPESFQAASGQEIDRTFGLGFASQLEPLSSKVWEGPLRSGMGAHLVWIESRVEGRLPELDEIRDVVEREWRNENRLASRKAINESLRDQYEVIVEWPESIGARLQDLEDGAEQNRQAGGSEEGNSEDVESDDVESEDIESEDGSLDDAGPTSQESSWRSHETFRGATA